MEERREGSSVVKLEADEEGKMEMVKAEKALMKTMG